MHWHVNCLSEKGKVTVFGVEISARSVSAFFSIFPSHPPSCCPCFLPLASLALRPSSPAPPFGDGPGAGPNRKLSGTARPTISLFSPIRLSATL